MSDDIHASSSPKTMQRSISMPVKPRYSEEKRLQRSEEKETLFEEDSSLSSSTTSVFLDNLNTKMDGGGIIFSIESKEEPSQAETKCSEVECRRRKSNFSDHLYRDLHGSTIELNRKNLWTCEENVNFKQTVRRHKIFRVVEKNGHENIVIRKIPKKTWRYFKDFVTTLIEQDWKYTLTMFFGSFFVSWFFFTILWYIVAYAHGDLFFDKITGKRLGEGKGPCIQGVYDMTSIFIFSVETQTTIGFGEKYPTEECPESVFIYVLQIIVSIAIEGAMVSIIYAKTARPSRVMTKLKFSDKAVVCRRDGQLCLMFRVCDPREQQIIGSKIRLYFLLDKQTPEGETLKLHKELEVQGNGRDLLFWPEIVSHVIDQNSPFYNFTAKDFHKENYELFVSLVGSSPATGQMTEARTSYVPTEVFWGQRFVNIINYDRVNERYVIDYGNFNSTISVDMNEDTGKSQKH